MADSAAAVETSLAGMTGVVDSVALARKTGGLAVSLLAARAGGGAFSAAWGVR